MYDLSAEAAKEDAEKLVQAFGQIFREALLELAEPFREFVYPWLDYVPADDLFCRILASVGLGVHQDIDPRLLGMDFQFDLPAYIKVVLPHIYQYAAGQEEKPLPERDATSFTRILSVLRKLGPVKYPLFTSRPGREFEMGLYNDLVSPRFGFAVSHFTARRRFEVAYTFRSVFPWPKAGTVSPRSLAVVANVSYSYIMKLIKTGKLRAVKLEPISVWEIPIEDAVKWLCSRKDAENLPNWLKRLCRGYGD
ncbi:MAG: hypothetical protein AB1327_08950 [Bacillota bacterium]